MELDAAKMIGAGLAVFPILGVGIGLGLIFSSLITSIGRNPAVEGAVMPKTMLGFALTEALALFALVISLLILYG